MFPVDCGDPGLPENSNREGDRFLFTDTVQFTCNDGYYQSSGDNNLTCLNTGEWNGTLPNCTGNKLTPHHVSNYDCAHDCSMHGY